VAGSAEQKGREAAQMRLVPDDGDRLRAEHGDGAQRLAEVGVRLQCGVCSISTFGCTRCGKSRRSAWRG
jgi:hypothetical protein